MRAKYLFRKTGEPPLCLWYMEEGILTLAGNMRVHEFAEIVAREFLRWTGPFEWWQTSQINKGRTLIRCTRQEFNQCVKRARQAGINVNRVKRFGRIAI